MSRNKLVGSGRCHSPGDAGRAGMLVALFQQKQKRMDVYGVTGGAEVAGGFDLRAHAIARSRA